MVRWSIDNDVSGHHFGIYEGDTEREALAKMLDACESWEDEAGLDALIEAGHRDGVRVSPAIIECAYCGVEYPDDGDEVVPTRDDDCGWDLLADAHAPNCEWIRTRSHSIDG